MFDNALAMSKWEFAASISTKMVFGFIDLFSNYFFKQFSLFVEALLLIPCCFTSFEQQLL